MAGLAAVLAGLAVASPAASQAPTLDGVRITGEPYVGSTLTAVLDGTVDPAGVKFKWCRVGDRPNRCAKGPALASGPAYVPVGADIGHSLLVKATATIETSSVEVTSLPTQPVSTPPPPPPPAPTPSPSPSPDPVPNPTPDPGAPAPPPVFTSTGDLPSAGEGRSAAPAEPQFELLRPFPVVRIRGSIARRGAWISMLRITASRDATVRVRCDGSSCPMRRRTRTVGRIRALERYLSAGTRITIRVRRPGYIGKYARIVIRAGRPPLRRDACVVPGSSTPVLCQAG